MASSGKDNVRGGRRTQSKSPSTRQQPIRVRQELPRRETRRSSTSTLGLSSRDHRIPIDCPWLTCNATTVHQHNNLLQFFNPHPANEIQYRGYVSSHRVAPWQADVATGGLTMQSQDIFESEILEETAQEQKENGQTSVTEDDETGDREEQLEGRTPGLAVGVAAPEEKSDAQISVASADLRKEQRGFVILNGAKPLEYIVMDDGNPDPGADDPITSRRTLDFVDLLTSRQESATDIDYETVANAWDSRGIHVEPQETPSRISPGLQDVFDEWLVPKTPEQAS